MSMNKFFAMIAAFAYLATTCESSQTSSGVIQIRSPRGPVIANVSVQRYDIAFPNRTRPADILTVYEPNSSLCWWRFGLLNSTDTAGSIESLNDTYTLYLTNDKLVAFRMDAPLLRIRESTQRATSLQDATSKALSDIAAKRSEILRGTVQWFTEVDLSQLGRDFFARKDQAATLDPARVTGVSFVGGRWEVAIEGPNGDRLIVTLDESYRLLGTRRAG